MKDNNNISPSVGPTTDDDVISNLLDLIYEFLVKFSYNETAEKLVDECRRQNVDLVAAKKETPSRNVDAAAFLSAFDSGAAEYFANCWDSSFGNDTAANIKELDFFIHVYFAVFPLRKAEVNSEAVEDSMRRFKTFIEGPGASLSQNPTLVPYYALPYVQEPRRHPLFRELFKPSWVTMLRNQLQEFLTSNQGSICNQPRLCQIYKDSVLKATSKPKQTNGVVKRKFPSGISSEHLLQIQFQKDYHSLILLTAELVDALEQTVHGHPVSADYLQDICSRMLQSRCASELNLRAVSQPQRLPSPSESPSERSDKDSVSLRNSRARNEDARLEASNSESASSSKSCSRTSSAQPDEGIVPSELNYALIKEALSVDGRHSCLLLQALRWRLTRVTKPVRDCVIKAFTLNDILALRDNIRIREAILLLLTSRSTEMRSSISRLINAMSSLQLGRRYLSKSQKMLTIMANLLKSESKQTPAVFDHVISALQKLSLRKSVQTILISQEVIEWLIGFLQANHNQASAYAVEYGVALLMNLSLRKAGKERCQRQPKVLVQLLTDLLHQENKEIYPYINGTLYSIMCCSIFRDVGRELNLETKFEALLQTTTSADIKKQLPFVLKQMRGELPQAVVTDESDNESEEDDDDEDEDTLEPEIDAADPVQVSGSQEMQGEELLKTQYYMHPSTQANHNGHLLPSPQRLSSASGADASDLSSSEEPQSSIRRKSVGRSTYVVHSRVRKSSSVSSLRNKPHSSQATLNQLERMPIKPTRAESTTSMSSRQSKYSPLPSPKLTRKVLATNGDDGYNNGHRSSIPRDAESAKSRKITTQQLDNNTASEAFRQRERIQSDTSAPDYVEVFGARPKIPRTPDHTKRRARE